MSGHVLKGCFVTGTDTGVGKTCVSAGLLHLLKERGLVVAGYKPVSAGTEEIAGVHVNEDVRQLREAGSSGFDDDDVGPVRLCTPCAPHLAAEVEGVAICRDELVDSAHSLQHRADAVVVEGVGGFVVPLGPVFDTTHLACALNLKVILVVGLRLGCLNHALLTAEVIRARRLRLAGWVGSVIDPNMLHLDGNLATLQSELQRRHGVPCLGIVPRLDRPAPEQVARHLHADAILDALDLPLHLPTALLA